MCCFRIINLINHPKSVKSSEVFCKMEAHFRITSVCQTTLGIIINNDQHPQITLIGLTAFQRHALSVA